MRRWEGAWTRCVLSLVLIAVGGFVLLSMATGGLAQAPVSAEIEDVQAFPGPASSPLVGFHASTEIQNPPAEPLAPRNLISPTATLDVDQLDDVDEDVPYRTYWTSSVRPRPATGLGFQVHNDGAHVQSAYGTVDAGTPVHEGDSKRVAIGVGPSGPLFPPREATSGGELGWEQVEPVRLQPSGNVSSADGNSRAAGQATAIGFMATLRVDGGGLTPDEDVVSPILDVPIPRFDPSVLTFTRPTSLPQIDQSMAFNITQTEDGTTHIRIQVGVGEASRWPQSTDEGSTGTWKFRIRVAGVGHETPADGADASTSAIQRDVLELGARPPGTQTHVVPDKGSARVIEAGPHAEIIATQDGQIEEIHAADWGQPAPQAEREPSGPGALRTSSATERCEQGFLTPSHAGFLPEGQMGLRLEDPGIYSVCMQGEDVGEIGLPFVTVDGDVHAPDFVEPASAILARSFGEQEAAGSQVTVVTQGTAGPVSFVARFIAIHTPWGGSTVYPWLTDMHVLDGQDHTVQFHWLADPDPGSNERFLVGGEVLQPLEGPIPSDAFSQTLAGRPHEIVADGDLTARLDPGSFQEGFLFAREPAEDELELLPPPLQRTTPPRPVLGEDVATNWPTSEGGTHSSWPYGQGDSYPFPFLWSVAGL